MANTKSFAEQTSADTTEIGFHYQYYYFLYRLLNLKTGQSVGLEVKDDVHTDLDNDAQILFQLKHTVQHNAAGKYIALTELDGDLWKTLHNWAKIISDKSVGRDQKARQSEFVKKTEFHLVSNKSESDRNVFLKNLEAYKSEDFGFEEFREYMVFLHEKTKDKIIKGYLGAVLALDNDILAIFLRKIHLELDIDDLHYLIKTAIMEKMIESSKVDGVFERLDSNIRTDNYIKIKAGQKVELDFDSFYGRYRAIFSASREPLQLGRPFTPAFPEDVFSQIFIRQLLAVNAIKIDDVERAFEYTTNKLKISRFLDDWLQSGELVADEIADFHSDVSSKWRNAFEHWCEDCLDHEVISKAKALLYDLRKLEFSIASSRLNTELSNGELYHLSDEQLIGWHRDWKTL
ncbi:ABC-three component system protein [Pseudomonas sp. W03]|uniref:ABC-three component system protein n=1 Tax=Pseudomonas sp. W03 TaxID=3090666 RepID=UPI003A4E19C7